MCSGSMTGRWSQSSMEGRKDDEDDSHRSDLFAAALAMATATVGGDKASPGRIREGALDEIDLTASYAPARAPVVLRRFAAEKADLGSAKEGNNQQRKDAVRFIQTEGPRMLAEALVADVRAGGVIPSVNESDQPAPEGSLVLEGEFEKIEPGSRAKRYWAGFGAGKSGITVTGRVLDSKGSVLATFRHTKNSGFRPRGRRLRQVPVGRHP